MGQSVAYSAKWSLGCLQQVSQVLLTAMLLTEAPTPLLTADHGWGQAGPSFAYSPSAAYSSGPDLLTAQVAYRSSAVAG